MLVELHSHIANLRRILVEMAGGSRWQQVTDLLHVAASVKSVNIDITQYIDGFGWCRDGDEYDLAREDLLKLFVTKLSVFTFVWGALEAALELIDPPKCSDVKKRGKIQDACRYLDQVFSHKPIIKYLLEEFHSLLMSAELCEGYSSIRERSKSRSGIGIQGLPLFVVYEIRNKFAHGALNFPEPDENNQPISEHANVIVHATRIVLISLQMLVLASKKESDELVYAPWYSEGDPESYELWFLLRACHLQPQEESQQLEMFENVSEY